MEDRERRPVAKTDEPPEEGAAEEVELHRRKAMPQASEETPAEGESEDDVELHRRHVRSEG